MNQNSSNGGQRRRRPPQRNVAIPFLAGPVAAKYPVRMCAAHISLFTGGREGETLQSRQEAEVSTGKSTRDKEKVGHHNGYNQRTQADGSHRGPRKPTKHRYRAGARRLVCFCVTLGPFTRFSFIFTVDHLSPTKTVSFECFCLYLRYRN